MRNDQAKADYDRRYWRTFLRRHAARGTAVIGYGAAAKATVWLNWVGVNADWMQYVVDSTPSKIGKYMPGTNIPILGHEHFRALAAVTRPVVIILAHNYKAEIAAKLPEGADWCVASL